MLPSFTCLAINDGSSLVHRIIMTRPNDQISEAEKASSVLKGFSSGAKKYELLYSWWYFVISTCCMNSIFPFSSKNKFSGWIPPWERFFSLWYYILLQTYTSNSMMNFSSNIFPDYLIWWCIDWRRFSWRSCLAAISEFGFSLSV